MLLADYAAVSEGKLSIVGGGWSITGPEIPPFAIALCIHVPWDRANEEHDLRLELLDSDGEPVTIASEESEEPIAIEASFEVGRPPGIKPGTPLEAMFAFNLSPPPPIPAGGRYEWRLTIDGEGAEDWSLAFSTRSEEDQLL
jgi:hypothetical protein